jgi:hypothetical protein
MTTTQDTEQDGTEDNQEAVQCQHPHCQKALLDGGQTYVGEHGNELVLCPTHYYKLVAGESAKTKTNTSVTTSEIPLFGEGGLGQGGLR